ncbi:MAG: tripartite tricarboxylate transporter permease [Burkholderiaceae bacterium]|jgi:putative tricarboxylic transport membrane protein|nr:tripartite tricarboxylate transporter permease [Burkholderiaceae bacterium]MDP4968505.1 tripartite tricarboxylate transporter permease [Burkholderiaceae bacterium]
MDLVDNITLGFSVAFQWQNLFFCFVGVLIGTLIGVLPGLGPVGAMAILLPITYGISPVTAIVMLAGIYYGAQYGGSTTSILVGIPGESSSVVTALDGHQMALQGRAGPALGIAAFSSFIAGTVAIVGLMLMSVPLVKFALKFGPAEYFSLMVLGLIILTYLAQKSMVKALLMASFGVVLGLIGLDSITGMPRFTADMPELLDGIGIAPLAMGLFGVSEILLNIERQIKRSVVVKRVKNLLPNLQDWKDSAAPMARGTAIGYLVGILPGGGTVLSSFLSYGVEKRLSKEPEKFGKGAIAGVAGPEASNNAAAQAGFIPLLSLGIPASAVMGILLGALMIHGIQPGPLLMRNEPELFWGVIASMYIGNIMLLVLNLPMIGLWVRLLMVPYSVLFPIILFVALTGAFVVNGSILDLYLMLGFGVLGYFMRKFDYEPAPLILAFVLAPILELSLRQSLIISGGDISIFFVRPISLTLLVISALLLLSALIPSIRSKREKIVAQAEEDV